MCKCLVNDLINMFVSCSESGEMCAMKEVTLFSDDAKSRESAKQLMQVIGYFFKPRKFSSG